MKCLQYKMALLDFTRAIHMECNNHHLWVYRGNVLLKMDRNEQAAFTVKQVSTAADMNSLAVQQQSLIYSFLKDHNKVHYWHA